MNTKESGNESGSSSRSIFDHQHCIRTLSGQSLSLIKPDAGSILIEDIARGLAYKSHFGGHTPKYFSVAEHSLLVMSLLPPALKRNPVVRLAALLHDAPEAYIGDCVKPLKDLLPDYVIIEKRLQHVILDKFGIPADTLKSIKPYDLRAQEIEYEVFYAGIDHGLYFLSPEQSLQTFLLECRACLEKYQSISSAD